MKNKRKTKGNNFLQEKKEIIYFVLYSLNFVYEFFFLQQTIIVHLPTCNITVYYSVCQSTSLFIK